MPDLIHRNKIYAIVDIETTGGKYNEEGITEIAIYKHDGHKIVDQFISLVDPEKTIQPYVVNLTGISNTMLKNAPKFFEVAKRIVEITENCVLVAHNAKFDMRMLNNELNRCGWEGYPEKRFIDTLKMARSFFPDEKNTLDALCKRYSIDNNVRNTTGNHNAFEDTMLLLQVYKQLINHHK